MDRYQRVERPRTESAAIEENEIRITAQGLIRNYVSYATSLLQVRVLPLRLSHRRRVNFRCPYGAPFRQSPLCPCLFESARLEVVGWVRWALEVDSNSDFCGSARLEVVGWVRWA